MLVAVPLVHRFQRFQRMMDGEFRALGQHVELGIGDHGGDLDDRIVVGVQPGHFQVDPDQSLVGRAGVRHCVASLLGRRAAYR